MACEFYQDWQTYLMDKCQYWDGKLCRNPRRNEWAIEQNTQHPEWSNGIRIFDCPTQGKER